MKHFYASIITLAIAIAPALVPVVAHAEYRAVRTDEQLGITRGLADGSLEPVVRDHQSDHDRATGKVVLVGLTPEETAANRAAVEQKTQRNMKALRDLSTQARCESGEKAACPAPRPKK